MTQENLSEPRIGYGSAQSAEQEDFDLMQEQLSNEQIDFALDSLIALYLKKQQPEGN